MFTPIIREKSDDFSFEEVFNKLFEAGKNQTNIGLAFERVEPDKMGKVINKDNIVFEVVN